MEDDRVLVEILDEREGVSWVVDEAASLVAEHSPAATVVDGAGRWPHWAGHCVQTSFLVPEEGVFGSSDPRSRLLAAA